MSKKIVFFIICTLIFLIIILKAFSWYMPWNKNKAKNIAIEYLKTKYIEGMNYLGIRIPFIDPVIYHVYFSPRNNSELKFEVLVKKDLTLPQNPDDYILQYFSFYASQEIQEAVMDIWNEDVKSRIVIINQPIYNFNVSQKLKENMALKEMAPFIDYDLFLNVNKEWQNGSGESKKILQLIQRVKDSSYTPTEISLFYLAASNKKMIFTFENWLDIKSVSQVEAILESESIKCD